MNGVFGFDEIKEKERLLFGQMNGGKKKKKSVFLSLTEGKHFPSTMLLF